MGRLRYLRSSTIATSIPVYPEIPETTPSQDPLRRPIRQHSKATESGTPCTKTRIPREGTRKENCRMNRQKILTTLLGLVLGLPLLAGAQGLGSISGTVTDPSGAIVVSAKVKVTDAATGFTREAATDSEGYYMISS